MTSGFVAFMASGLADGLPERGVERGSAVAQDEGVRGAERRTDAGPARQTVRLAVDTPCRRAAATARASNDTAAIRALTASG